MIVVFNTTDDFQPFHMLHFLLLLLCSVVGKIFENDGVKFLRMANDRGWATVSDVDGGGGDLLFVEVEGDLVSERWVGRLFICPSNGVANHRNGTAA